MRVLDKDDATSRTWKKLHDYLTLRLESLRRKNDEALPDERTARLRGQIAEVKHMLSLTDEQPTQPTEDDKFKD